MTAWGKSISCDWFLLGRFVFPQKRKLLSNETIRFLNNLSQNISYYRNYSYWQWALFCLKPKRLPIGQRNALFERNNLILKRQKASLRNKHSNLIENTAVLEQQKTFSARQSSSARPRWGLPVACELRILCDARMHICIWRKCASWDVSHSCVSPQRSNAATLGKATNVLRSVGGTSLQWRTLNEEILARHWQKRNG